MVTRMQLQASCIELLQVMLEETNEKSSELAQGISEDLDIATLLKAMVQLRVSIAITTSIHIATT